MTDGFLTKLVHNRLINVKDYIINNYVKLGLNEQEAMLLLHIYHLSEAGEQFLAINTLKAKTTLDFVTCANTVYRLVQLNLIAFDIEIDNKGITKEKFTLEPLYNLILKDLMDEKLETTKNNDENEIGQLVTMIEMEFGRTLSSFEVELISGWVNGYHYDVALIKLALKEAIIAKVFNLKYIDRVLLNWQDNQIDTLEKAAEYSKTFKRFESKKTAKTDEEVYVSWMK